MGQTNAHARKLEGRAIVPIGIRDTIVSIEVLQASIGSIVTIATAIRHAETRNSSHVETATDIINDDTLQNYIKYEYGKYIKEQIVFFSFKSPLRGYRGAVLRTLGSLYPTDTPSPRFLRLLCYHAGTSVGVVSQSSSASQRGEPWRPLAYETPLQAMKHSKPALAP